MTSSTKSKKCFQCRYIGCEWIEYIWADSLNQAKATFHNMYDNEGDYIEVRARRVPELDNDEKDYYDLIAEGYYTDPGA